ncbi:MAG: amidohydrolase family protein, partial [Pseudomonadota bacterium]
GEQRKTPGGYRPIIEEGLLGQHTAVHANFFEDDEVKLLIDNGASFTATPSCEIGVPKPPLISSVIRAGGRPSIAIDSEIDITGNMFDAMRTARQLQATFDAIEAFDPAATRESAGRPDIDAIVTAQELTCSSLDVLEWATINNAYAMGLEAQIGSLTPGKRADIVLLRKTDLNLMPVTDPVQSIVMHANQSNVDTVFIDGELRKRHGSLLARPPGLATKAEGAARRLLDLADQLGRPLRSR